MYIICRLPGVHIDHNIRSQKLRGTTQRYTVDSSAYDKLYSELARGNAKVINIHFMLIGIYYVV